MIHLDTHVVVWLYAGQTERFSSTVVDVLERDELVISPMVLLELEYLFESGRITVDGQTIVDDLRQRVGLRQSPASFTAVIEQARTQTWTRDPFDRVIVGQASAEGARLVTKDRRIWEHYARSVWGDDADAG